MIGNLRINNINEFDLLMALGFDGSWNFNAKRNKAILEEVCSVLNKQSRDTKLKIMVYEDKEINQEECTVLLSTFVSELNKQTIEKPLGVIVYEYTESDYEQDLKYAIEKFTVNRERPKSPLTDEEKQIIQNLYSKGCSKYQISNKLHISIHTVNKYCK